MHAPEVLGREGEGALVQLRRRRRILAHVLQEERRPASGLTYYQLKASYVYEASSC
jgi:hypothetical protein